MKRLSKITKHEYYNLYQRLVMGKMLSGDELDSIPELPGAYIIWLDEAPPQCLKVGVVSPKQENGLREELELILKSEKAETPLVRELKKDRMLAKKYKMNFNKEEERRRFLYERVYYQVLPLSYLPADEFEKLYDYLENDIDFTPRFTRSSRERG